MSRLPTHSDSQHQYPPPLQFEHRPVIQVPGRQNTASPYLQPLALPFDDNSSSLPLESQQRNQQQYISPSGTSLAQSPSQYQPYPSQQYQAPAPNGYNGPNSSDIAPYSQNTATSQGFQPEAFQNDAFRDDMSVRNSNALMPIPHKPRQGSYSSRLSHESSRSHRSHHSRSSRRSRRSEKNWDKRPSWGDSVFLVWDALKGAWSKRS